MVFSETDKPSALFKPLTIGALLVVIGVQFGFLTWHSLWNNEFITLTVLDYDYPQLIAERIGRNHMPLYFVLLKAWTTLFGRSEFALHFPSAVFSLAGILVVWRLAVYLIGPRMGLFVLLVTGLNQIHLHMAQDARMYSWLFLNMALALTGLIRYLEEGRRRWLALLAAAGIVGLAVQLLHLFLIGIFAVFLIARRRAYPQRWRPALLCTLAPLLLMTPMIYWWTQVQDKVGGDGELGTPALSSALRQTANIFLGDKDYIDSIDGLQRVLAGGALLLAVHAWWRVRQGRDPLPPPGVPSHRPYIGLWLGMWLTPLVGVALAGMKSRENLVNNWRYYLVLAPAAPLLLATALRNLQERGRARIADAVGMTMIIVCVAFSVAYLRSPEEGVREAAFYLRDHRQPGDALLAGLKKMRTEGFVYYGASERRPAQLLKRYRSPEQVLDWITRQGNGSERIWAIYYGKPGKSPMHDILSNNPQYFTRGEEAFKYGDTTVQLYLTSPAFRALRHDAPDAAEEATSAMDEDH